MKKYIKYIGILSIFCLVACNDSFLDRETVVDFNNKNFWNSASEMKVYNNGIYNEAAKTDNTFIRGSGSNSAASKNKSFMSMEVMSDNLASTETDLNIWREISGGIEVITGNIPSLTVGSNWRWDLLRRCNFFLENYERGISVPEGLRNNYAGEVYFWRAWFYYDKVQEFGDVPLITKSLTMDSPEIYGSRTDRKLVMEQVLADINKAIEFLPEAWDVNHPNRVNKWVAQALKSRICLFEGTFRKYHKLGDAEKFLTEAVSASEAVIQSGKFSIYKPGDKNTNYRKLFVSEDLSSNPEVIYNKLYSMPGLGHSLSRSINDNMLIGATYDFVEDFLCIESDGTAKPVALSKTYKDDAIEQVFDNRDPRLAQTVLDPRRELEIYNIDTKNMPGFNGMPGVSNFFSLTGFNIIKYFDNASALKPHNAETNDYPLIRYAEILLNYAEAKAELGTLTQTDLDMSINKLRDRVEMPHLDMNPPMDPKYANEGISSILVEIRRERRVELSCENFRYFDLMRWKKGANLAKPVLGMKMKQEDLAEGGRYYKAKIKLTTIDGVSYVDPYAGTTTAIDKRKFDENKNYLHPIPINVKAKNDALVQTQGW